MKNEEKPKCDHCGEPGGRVVIDPYSQELFGEKIRMRLHPNCEQMRREDV